ncbi:MAG: aromatic amino acid ammonia-lyase [Vitreimonas sp.]
MAAARSIVLNKGSELSLADVVACAAQPAVRVSLADGTKTYMAALRRAAEEQLAADPDRRVYGLNTGFGSNFRDYVSPERLRQLQRNLIVSHCAGMGPPAPRDVVRATMLLRARSLAEGQSVIRPLVVETLLDLLNKDIVPSVPAHGSVSASGDLAPLSHVAAVLIGEGAILLDVKGRAAFGAESVETARYLTEAAKHGLPTFTPVTLEMKEGLALNNGCQYSAAWALLAAARMRTLIETAALTTALGVQAMVGMGRPFRADLHALRPHPGAQEIAGWIWALLDGYAFRDASADDRVAFDGEIQDPYNLRCAPQVLGACLDLIKRAETTLLCEANSVTDNPIDLNTNAASYRLDEITSGGHFHGMPVAVDAFGLLQAAGIMARLSNMRCVRYVDARRNKGLGPQVRGEAPDVTESGLLIAEYTTAGLCNEIWGLAMPSHLMSMSTDSGQEDHVSMAASVAMRAYQAASRLAEVLAIELAYASQAMITRSQNDGLVTRVLDQSLGGQTPAPSQADWGGRRRTIAFEKTWRMSMSGAELAASTLTAPAIAAIRQAFPPVERDREVSKDMMVLAAKVLAGEIADATGFRFARH